MYTDYEEEITLKLKEMATDNISQSQILDIKEAKNYSIVKLLAVSVSLVFLFLFLFGQEISLFFLNHSLDNSVFGVYGDFIGGVVGTGIALYSAYLLYRTLQDQIRQNEETKKVNLSVIETNQSVVSTNNAVISTNRIMISQTYLSLFNDKFTSFLNLYHKAVSAYTIGGKNGKEAFVSIMDSFGRIPFTNNSTYLNRTNAAVKEYEQLYATNCREMSVHLRMLYHLARLLGETEYLDDDGNTILSEQDRILYAKCLRGQLCDEEMLMLRYNCLTFKGRNMQDYVNKFNLIKHLPIMSLLEFNKWSVKLSPDSTLISCMNAHLIALKKFILESSKAIPQSNTTFLDTRKYKIEVEFSDSGKRLTLTITIKDPVGSPGIQGEALIDKALSRYDKDELGQLFVDFLREALLVSNFYLYNGKDGSMIHTIPSVSGRKVTCIANNTKPWILAAWQM